MRCVTNVNVFGKLASITKKKIIPFDAKDWDMWFTIVLWEVYRGSVEIFRGLSAYSSVKRPRKLQ